MWSRQTSETDTVMKTMKVMKVMKVNLKQQETSEHVT